MVAVSKRQKKWSALFNPAEQYAVNKALDIVRKCATCKFEETIECSFSLGIDPSKSDQTVRGVSQLPHGLGKKIRVAVFTGDDLAQQAKEWGAEKAGLEDLAEEIKQGQMDFDVVIASPDAMRVVGQLGQLLGPRGLMPNPKLGTVTDNIEQAIKNAKAGQAQFRSDKGGIVNCPIGKVKFNIDHLRDNLLHLYADLTRAKPASSKGVYFRRLTVSSTMGPGVMVDLSSLKSSS